jgi:uncharacterized protein YlzI (FlbEa/FlbD family)
VIKLTDRNGEALYVRPEAITHMQSLPAVGGQVSTKLWLISQTTLGVEETPDLIRAIIYASK